MELDQLNKAEENLRSVLELQPLHANAKNNLALVYQRQGRLFEAEKLLRQLVQDDPWNIDININLTGILLQQGRPNEGAALLYPALKRHPHSPIGWSSLASCLLDIGDLEASMASFFRAHQQDPRNVDPLFHLHGLVHDLRSPELALEILEKALFLSPEDMRLHFYRYIVRDWYGFPSTTFQSSGIPDSWISSLDYIREHRMKDTRLFYSVAQSLEYAVQSAVNSGSILEFGVRYGTSIKMLERFSGQKIEGFDSFQGLPTEWHTVPQGAYSTNGVIPDLGDNITLHAGWFSDTLKPFVAQNPEPIRLLHIDCDLYSSTIEVLTTLEKFLVPNSVVVFDEYIMNPKWQEDEYRAWIEFIEERNIRYEYLAFSPKTFQAVLRILA